MRTWLAGRLLLESKYDARFKVVFDAIRQLMSPQVRASRRIGFRPAGGPEADAP
jgi:hypothetical protein